jgi:16S rRNA (adenine1518-N6/adenine1519-N6)-dimethyltransferase
VTKISPLTSVAKTREVLKSHGLATKKFLGQHFLINDGVILRICDLADMCPSDTVLEIGPGLGTLTVALLKKAKYVIAVERDKDLIEVLRDTTRPYTQKLALLTKDALQLSDGDINNALEMLASENHIDHKSKISHADKPALPSMVVSNLPYNVAATLVLNVFENFAYIKSATVMVQSEVALRMRANPGTKDYGAYTVKLALYARCTGHFHVAPQNFYPPPHVESTVIRLERIELKDKAGKVLDASAKESIAFMADAAFANRRKTLLNSCKTFFAASGAPFASQMIEKLPYIIEEAGIDDSIRGEALTLEDFIELGRSYERFSIE